MNIPTVPLSVAERRRLSPSVLSGVVGFVEGMLTLISGFAMFYLYLRNAPEASLARYSVMMLGGVQIQIVALATSKLYNLAAFRRPLYSAGRVFLVWSLVFAALLTIAFLTKTSAFYSRVWLTGWYVLGFGMLLISRAVLSVLVRRWTLNGRLVRRVVIVGADERAEKLIDALEASKDDSIHICGIFDDRLGRAPERVRNYPVLGSVKALVEFARTRRVDLLIVNLPIAAERRIQETVRQLHVLPVDIRLWAHATGLRFTPRSYSYVGKVPMFEVANRPVADWDYVLKAIEDRVLAAFLLLVALPVFAMVAVAIKFDSKGTIFFRQKRYGFNNELIEVYKFRTLRSDMTDHKAEKLVTADDPRVTRVGRFLRRTSLDELPQLITVLKGGMSIVGPRPHATAAKAGDRLYQEVVDGYYARHRVKPGITGWAQINGWRGETDTEDKILRRTEHDLYYIDNWSLWLDFYIIAKTPWALLKGENAY